MTTQTNSPLSAANLHPVKQLVTLDEMRALSPNAYLVQRKMDGALDQFTVGEGEILCEFMKRRSGGHFTLADEAMFQKFPHGWRAAFTVARWQGQSVLHQSTGERWGMLCALAPHFPPDILLVKPATVPAKLTDEEGYVATSWGQPWGTLLAVKQEQIYECEVLAVGGTQSVEVKVLATGAICRVKLGGGRCDQVRQRSGGQSGSIIRVECLNLTDDGKLYQPRPCRAWLKIF